LLLACPGAKVAVALMMSWNSMPLVMPCLRAPVFRTGCRRTCAFDIQQVITEAILLYLKLQGIQFNNPRNRISHQKSFRR
jgi:hypothetical protein